MKVLVRKLNKKNYNDCLKIKTFLFPESNSNQDYTNYFLKKQKCEYFVFYINKKPCAITGWYDFDGKNVDAFMGWFGVMPEYRCKGLGSYIFDFTFKRIKKHKYNYFRTYTDKVVNADSIKLYKKKNMLCENYSYDDNVGKNGNFVVFSKVIKSNGNDLWNNRPLNEDDNYSDI
ncbi:MAG: GNAT family N-acetyltransferase [Clostridia bacterium]|nr:GNAT family N-acetyltransferase [Clostridia bacterium]